MDEVECMGTERSMDLCPFNGWGDHDCSHSEDAGVVCQGEGVRWDEEGVNVRCGVRCQGKGVGV